MNTDRIAFVALWFFVFSMPWERSVSIPGLGAAGTLFGIIAFGFGVFAVIRGGTIRAKVPSLFLLVFALFVLWMGASFFWSINEEGATTRFETYLQFLIMAWLVWELCRTEKRRLGLLQAYLLGAYIVMGIIIYQFIANPFVPNEEASMHRYTGVNDNANSVATFIAIGIAMAWYLAMNFKRGLKHWLFLAYLPASVMALGLIASRGGMIIAIVCLCLIPLTYGYLSITRRVIFTILIGSVSVFAISNIPEDNLARLSEATEEITEGDVSNRTQIWEAGLQAYQDSPVVGLGAGSYGTAVERIRGFGAPAHSAYFSTLVELGVIGLALFLIMMTVPVLPLLQLPFRDCAFYMVLWVAILVAFMPTDWHTFKVPWFLLSLFTTHRAYVVLPSSVNLTRRRKRPARVQGQPRLEAQ